MDDLHRALLRLLRAQLTAVNQQFTHMLALGTWGEKAAADQIKRVDDVDFVVSMKILDHLVAARVPLALTYEPFYPGDTLAEICAVERASEDRMASSLSLALHPDHPAHRWLEEARSPRRAYRAWLAQHTVADDTTQTGDPTPADRLFADLIALIEQPMIHAFIHWHRGRQVDADIAWATSGVAMMKGGALTRDIARTGRSPKSPPGAELTICETPQDAIEADRVLARRCALSAMQAAAASPPRIARRCAEIAAYARRVAEANETPHASLSTAAPCFCSFKITIETFIDPKPATALPGI
ncbi:MAG: hypothetical protein AAGF44_07000 [Pseudomonadota bacterium]